MVSSYEEHMGKPMDVKKHPVRTDHAATLKYAGDVIHMPDTSPRAQTSTIPVLPIPSPAGGTEGYRLRRGDKKVIGSGGSTYGAANDN